MAETVGDFIERGWVNLVGGCCGTTPEHIRALAERAEAGRPRKPPAPPPGLALSGLEPLLIDDESLFVNVGERTNMTGSARFRRLVKAGDFATALGHRPRAGGERRPDHRREHGRRNDRRRRGHAALPQPRHDRAGHRPRAGDDRFQRLERDRSRPALRAGQVRRQLDQPQGWRRGVPARGAAVPALRSGGGGDGLRRARPGGFPRTPPGDRRALLPAAGGRGGLSAPGHRLRRQRLRHRHRHRGTQRLRSRLHRRRALDQRALSAGTHLRRHQQRLVLLPRQRPRTRSHPRRFPLPRHRRRLDHGHRQRRPARHLRRHPRRPQERGGGRGAEPPRGCGRAPAGSGRALQRHGPKRRAAGRRGVAHPPRGRTAEPRPW